MFHANYIRVKGGACRNVLLVGSFRQGLLYIKDMEHVGQAFGFTSRGVGTR